MANNQNFSSLLLDNIVNRIPITSELMTPSKDGTDTTGRPTLSKSINHSQAVIAERYVYHLEQQVLILLVKK